MSLRAKANKQRTLRSTTPIFSLFTPAQITTLKETFTLIDTDNDGFIDHADLVSTLTSLGHAPTPMLDAYVSGMLADAPGAINFTMFLTMVGERLAGYDGEEELLAAFECFDERGTGVLDASELREWLTTMGGGEGGAGMQGSEIEALFRSAACKGGVFDYRAFVASLRNGV